MEILLDSADPMEISQVAGQGLISGVTTKVKSSSSCKRGGLTYAALFV